MYKYDINSGEKNINICTTGAKKLALNPNNINSYKNKIENIPSLHLPKLRNETLAMNPDWQMFTFGFHS